MPFVFFWYEDLAKPYRAPRVQQRHLAIQRDLLVPHIPDPQELALVALAAAAAAAAAALALRH